MKLLIIGGNGTIGKKVSAHFSTNNEVIIAGRNSGDILVNIEESASIKSMFDQVGKLDAIICIAGEAVWKSFNDLTEDDYFIGFKSKLMGQVNVVRIGKTYLRPNGSITLTTGILADDPVVMTSSAAMVNGAIHSFVKAVVLELENAIRVNVVSSGVVEDAYEKYRDSFPGHNPIPMQKVVNGYYEFLNTKVKEVVGGSHSAKCIMVSVDFAEIEHLTFKGNWKAIGKLMKEAAQQLERAGADVVLLCTNTIHVVSKDIIENITIPFIHIASTTGASIKKRGLKKVALLGTKFTMERDFYTKTLTDDFGLEVLTPDTLDRQMIHDIIYNELVKGQFTDVSKQKIIRIIKRLQDHGAQGVILGCTELPILISDSDVEIPTFDTGKIHADSAIEWSLIP